MPPPRVLLALLRWRLSPLLARLLLAAPFFVGACCRLDDWNNAVVAVSAAGAPAAPLIVAGVILAQGAGAVLLAWRRLVWLGAAVLTAVTIGLTAAGTRIWAAPHVGVMHEVMIVVSAAAVIGALGLAAIQTEPPDL